LAIIKLCTVTEKRRDDTKEVLLFIVSRRNC